MPPRSVEPGLVAIDPGHGGHDPGAVASDGTREKDLNLAAALSIRWFLEQRGVPVWMTRRTDVYPALRDRTRDANARGAALFVSVHHDMEAATRPGVYHNDEPRAIRVANDIAARLSADAWVRSHRTSRFGRLFIADFRGPAVLLELGPTRATSDAERIGRAQAVVGRLEAEARRLGPGEVIA